MSTSSATPTHFSSSHWSSLSLSRTCESLAPLPFPPFFPSFPHPILPLHSTIHFHLRPSLLNLGADPFLPATLPASKTSRPTASPLSNSSPTSATSSSSRNRSGSSGPNRPLPLSFASSFKSSLLFELGRYAPPPFVLLPLPACP
jgi:hypothetical protein